MGARIGVQAQRRGHAWMRPAPHDLKAASGAHNSMEEVAPIGTITMLKPLCAALILSGMGSAATGSDASADLRGPWKVTEIEGATVPDHAPAEIEFLEDGALAGNAGCNWLMGSYELGAEGRIILRPGGVTMMACPEDAMALEDRLLGLLPQITSYAVDKGGALILTTDAGRHVRATRR